MSGFSMESSPELDRVLFPRNFSLLSAKLQPLPLSYATSNGTCFAVDEFWNPTQEQNNKNYVTGWVVSYSFALGGVPCLRPFRRSLCPPLLKAAAASARRLACMVLGDKSHTWMALLSEGLGFAPSHLGIFLDLDPQECRSSFGSTKTTPLHKAQSRFQS